jgi:endoglucanase
VANIVLSRNGKDTPFAIHGKLHVEGSHLIDEKGQICELRGLSTHNLSTYPEYINEEAITQFVDEYCINIFRLALYSAEADGCKGYSDGDDAHRESLEKLIIKGVEICAKLSSESN